MKRLAASAALKLSYFLKNRVGNEFFDRYSHLISANVTDEDIYVCPVLPKELIPEPQTLAERYQKLYDICGGDVIAMAAIQLYILVLMDERALSLIREGTGSADGLNIETAGRIEYFGCETVEILPQLKAAFEKVKVLLRAESGREPLRAPFRVDWRLALWLLGDDTPDEKLKAVTTEYYNILPEPIIMQKEIESAAKILKESDGCRFLHISGEKGSGRRFFARHTAKKLMASLLIVDFNAVAVDGVLQEDIWQRVLRELLLTDRILCLCDIDCPEKDRAERIPALLHRLEEDLSGMDRPVFLTTSENIKAVPFMRQAVYTVSIAAPTISQSEILWREMAGQYLKGVEIPTEKLAAKMTLTPGQIERVIKLMRLRKKSAFDEREVFKLCYQVLDDGRYENIRFVDTAYRWEDLQLDEQLKSALRAVCAQVEHQGLVLDEWGLRRRYPYGRCVSVLMSGPPGTGKSMTAQVLSSKLGLELYKVDLSQIVDKYIGETEKRLKQVFDQAEKSNMILFFDEADALLGKRSEVKESKDKYANTEVAYLLQRIEEYHGIVIMATNQAGNIDSAFIRRFRYHLVFTLPDSKMRLLLWQEALKGIPAVDIQTEYLAEEFELSGAQIKNIVLNAAYRAADDGGRLNMRHLVTAIYLEFKKEGKVMLSGDFGGYGVMLSDYISGGEY